MHLVIECVCKRKSLVEEGGGGRVQAVVEVAMLFLNAVSIKHDEDGPPPERVKEIW